MRFRFYFASLPLLLLTSLALAEEPPKPQPLILIKATHLVDPVSGTVRENQAILIEGDKVKSTGTAVDLTKNIRRKRR